eukprot:536445-Pelagomonas_calceolata.AAC.6
MAELDREDLGKLFKTFKCRYLCTCALTCHALKLVPRCPTCAGARQGLLVTHWEGQDHEVRQGCDTGVVQQDGGLLPEGCRAAAVSGHQLRGENNA